MPACWVLHWVLHWASHLNCRIAAPHGPAAVACHNARHPPSCPQKGAVDEVLIHACLPVPDSPPLALTGCRRSLAVCTAGGSRG